MAAHHRRSARRLKPGLRLWITPNGQLDAAAAGAELVELELELSDDELDFSEDEDDDDELVDSALPLEPFDELVAEAFAASRLSLR